MHPSMWRKPPSSHSSRDLGSAAQEEALRGKAAAEDEAVKSQVCRPSARHLLAVTAARANGSHDPSRPHACSSAISARVSSPKPLWLSEVN